MINFSNSCRLKYKTYLEVFFLNTEWPGIYFFGKFLTHSNTVRYSFFYTVKKFVVELHKNYEMKMTATIEQNQQKQYKYFRKVLLNYRTLMSFYTKYCEFTITNISVLYCCVMFNVDFLQCFHFHQIPHSFLLLSIFVNF